MSNLIPRTDVPQPKVFQMDPPPNFTVPEVTYLFNSFDSLAWKPGENMIERNKNSNKTDHCNLVFPLPQNKNKAEIANTDTGNAAINIGEKTFEKHVQKIVDQNFLRKVESPTATCAFPTTVASTNNNDNNNNKSETPEQNKFRLNKGYCPELYCSPKQISSQQRNEEKVLKSNVICNEIDKMRLFSHRPKVSDRAVNKIESSVYKCNPQTTGTLHRCECCNNHQLQFTAVPNSCHPPIMEAPCQSHILKVIEKQNEHILYLQNILEKLLHNSVSKDSTESQKCKHCSDLKKNNNNNNKKDVSTQTSDSEFLSKTKSIGTNTENQPLKNIPSNNVSNKNSCNRNCCQQNDCNSVTLKNDKIVKDSTNKERILSQNDFNDPLSPKNTNNYNVETAYNAPCSKLIQMDMAEFNEYTETECPGCPDCYYGTNRGGTCEETAYSDSPLPGESAIMFNERLMQQNQQFSRHQNNAEAIQEDNNGVTYSKRVMINFHQVVHKSNLQEKKDNKAYRKDHFAVPKMAATDPFCNSNQTIQQLQRFGISFLDPITLENKRKPPQRKCAPYDDKGAHHDEYEVINNKNKGRPANYNTADSHLAFIAQNSPAMINARRKHHIRDQQESLTSADGQNEAFSFATKQFLNRYKLEKDCDK